MAKDALKAVAAGAAVGAGAVALACAIVAPRKETPTSGARWRQIKRYRYAHRGLHDASEGIPENSLAAFRRAREHGFGAELDVHLTADGGLVVFHDSDTRRMTGEEGTIEEMTLGQIGTLRLLGTDEHVPTFEEVLEVYASSSDEPAPPLIVEIKTLLGSTVDELCTRVMEALDASRVAYCIESFDPRVLFWLKKNRPEVVRGYLSQDFVAIPESTLKMWQRVAASFLFPNALARPDFVAYRRDNVSHPAVKLACNIMGAHLVTWTVRSAEELAHDEGLGAIGIFEGFVPAAK